MEQIAKEVVLTYETLYELLRKEKAREELQKIEINFFADVLTYLREKQQAYDENLIKNDIFSQSERDKLHIQLANAKKLLRDLYDIRERKIINMAINHSRTKAHIVDTTALLFHEASLFERIINILSQSRIGTLHKLIELREPDIMPNSLDLPQLKEEPPASATATKQVKFLDKIEQFVGEELEMYGPFETNDEATLPTDLAEVLISQGKALEL